MVKYVRLVSLLLVMVLFLGIPVSSSAEEEILPYYLHIDSVQAKIILSGSIVTCKGTGSADADSVKLTLSLQRRSSSNAAWTTVTTWTTRSSGGQPASITETYSVTDGYEYRTRATVSVYNSSGALLEQASASSIVV